MHACRKDTVMRKLLLALQASNRIVEAAAVEQELAQLKNE